MKKGFTLVELIIVIVILAALAGAVIPAFTSNKNQARGARIQADLEAIKSAMYVYKADTGAFPGAISDLVNNSGNVSGYNGPYLDRLPVNPCSNNYTYNNASMGTASFLNDTSSCNGTANIGVQVHA